MKQQNRNGVIASCKDNIIVPQMNVLLLILPDNRIILAFIAAMEGFESASLGGLAYIELFGSKNPVYLSFKENKPTRQRNQQEDQGYDEDGHNAIT